MTPSPAYWLRAAAVTSTFVAARLAAAAALGAWTDRPLVFDGPGEIVGGLVAGAMFAWLAPRLGGPWWGRTFALGLLAFTSVAAVMLEGSAFAPELSPPGLLPAGLVLQLGVSLVTVAVAVRIAPGAQSPAPIRRLPTRSLPWRVALAALAYVAAYVVTGAINYLLVTGPYYETHAGGLVTPEPSIVLAVALVEGVLLALGVTPLARALAGSGRSRAIACGLALWILGGVVPLLQVASLPDVLRVASAVEILFQKVPLGIAVVWLLAPADR